MVPKLATDLKAPNRTEDAEQLVWRMPCCDDVRARVSRAEFLSHNSRCSVEFSLARGGGRGRRGARSAARRGVRRVSASAKTWRLAARTTPGGLGRYWAAQWHLARAVDKRFRGCRAKRLYLHMRKKKRGRGSFLRQTRNLEGTWLSQVLAEQSPLLLVFHCEL